MVTGVFGLKKEPGGWFWRFRMKGIDTGGGPYKGRTVAVLGLLYSLAQSLMEPE